MSKYLHHLLFDPLSAWEKTKADLLFASIVLGIVVLVMVIDELRKRRLDHK